MVRRTMNAVCTVATLLALSGTAAAAQAPEVTIGHPITDSEVAHTALVRGTVSDHQLQVYVLVHPMTTNLWWVQPIPAPANKDGTWETLCYFGTTTEGRGDFFQVIAIVAEQSLRDGQTFRDIPAHRARSDIVTVRRTTSLGT